MMRYVIIIALMSVSTISAQTPKLIQLDSVEEIYTNFRQKKTFSFSGISSLSEKVTYSWNGNWVPNNKSCYIYDDAGNNISLEVSKIGDGVENDNSVYKCKAEYDEDHRMKSFFCQKGKDREIEYEELYSYNNDGKMCYVIGELLQAGQRELYQIMKCEYDDSTCIKTLYRTSGKALNPYRKEVLVSDENGHLVWYELWFYNESTRQWKQNRCESYLYDVTGKIIQKKNSIIWVDRTPRSPAVHDFRYNESGDIIEVKSYNTKEGIKSLESVITYSYDIHDKTDSIVGSNTPNVLYTIDYDNIGDRTSDILYNQIENKIVDNKKFNHKVMEKKYLSNNGSVYEHFIFHYNEGRR